MKITWTKIFITISLTIILSIIATVLWIDPYFHYHAPLGRFQYRLYDERYQNDGILRHFDYDSIIIGTSMTRNFRASEWDALMSAKTVKVPFSGASYKEIGDTLKRVLARKGDKINYVVRGIDYSMLSDSPDSMRYDSYPTYLYDNNYLNDVEYLLNKQVLLTDLYNGVIEYTNSGLQTVDFDRYRNDDKGVYGKEHVMSTYTREEKTNESGYFHLNPENIQQNVIQVASDNPNTEIFLFITPYSILYFDQLNQRGELKNHLQQEKEAIEMLLEIDNIHVFSFFDEFDLITNFDNYLDYLHYGQDINSYILECMANGTHELTKDNYIDYCNRCKRFYENYDYDVLFE